MDSLTAYYVARELATRWHGRRVRACVFDRARRTVTVAVDGVAPVRFDLSASDVRVCEAPEPPAGGVAAGWRVTDVSAPPDDRRLVIHLEKPGKFRGSAVRRARLAMSVVPAARGAVLTEGGHRLATMGAVLPPDSAPRPLLTSEEVRRAVARNEPGALLGGRWMSQPLAHWLVQLDPASAAAEYAALCALPDARPSWCEARLLPFPWCRHARPAPSLIDGVPAECLPASPSSTPQFRRVARMREELARAAGAPALRRAADALLALGDVPAPAEVETAGGDRLPVPASAGETAVHVAARLYREVRSMERALQSLPARIAAERDASAAGTAPAEAMAPSGATAGRRSPEARAALPYRRYRSRGGLDIWVGRGAASNDALTFRHASPNDVWLHARDAAGAHVVLRWPHEASPPARDLDDAAMLAAWHSKMRSSTLVPVDWTRRRYVRKVRGGAPGLVSVQRARTVFVRPSAAGVRALRAEP